jgi:hypothetical protein
MRIGTSIIMGEAICIPIMRIWAGWNAFRMVSIITEFTLLCWYKSQILLSIMSTKAGWIPTYWSPRFSVMHLEIPRVSVNILASDQGLLASSSIKTTLLDYWPIVRSQRLSNRKRRRELFTIGSDSACAKRFRTVRCSTSGWIYIN